jgi:N-acetylglucosamine-6-phosphate deacetylase
MAIALTGATVFDGGHFLENHSVVIEGEKIAAVVSGTPDPRHDLRHVKLKGGILAPGFVDLQMNGGGGALLNHKPDVDVLRIIAASHRKHGTVAMLPTVITDQPAVTAAAIQAVSRAIKANVPGIIGIHIEGPFLDKARKGAHDAKYIRDITLADMNGITSADCGIKLVTLAPNRVPPSRIRQLVKRGCIVSLGHSDAGYKTVVAGLHAGATGFTHLYNAMSQLTGREPGMVGAALCSDAFVGLIADGHHVHVAALKLAIAAKGVSRCMLVTDAMPSAAGGPASFKIQGRKVVRRKGRLELPDGTLAGSDLTMDRALRFCVNTLGIKLADALCMASRTPAAFLNRDHELGIIKPGARASLVHLDDKLKVTRTWINGT